MLMLVIRRVYVGVRPGAADCGLSSAVLTRALTGSFCVDLHFDTPEKLETADGPVSDKSLHPVLLGIQSVRFAYSNEVRNKLHVCVIASQKAIALCICLEHVLEYCPNIKTLAALASFEV